MSDDGWVDVPAATAQDDDGWTDVPAPKQRSAEYNAEADKLRRIAADTQDSPFMQVFGPAIDATAKTVGSHPEGLERTEKDGWITGARKGGTSAIISGVSDIPGTIGNFRELGKFVVDEAVIPAAAGATNFGRSILGKEPVSADDWRDAVHRYKADHQNVLDAFPTGDDIASPILKRMGNYEPETEIGRLAKTGVRAGVGSVGFGAPSSAAKAIIKGEAASAPKIAAEAVRTNMAVKPVLANAGYAAFSEGVSDATGSPLAGLVAGAVSPVATHYGSRAGKWAVAPALPESLSQGMRERAASESILRTSQNPDEIFDWANSDQEQKGLPDSPKTLGQTTGDVGLLRHEHEQRTAHRDFANEMIELGGKQTAARHRAFGEMTPDSSNPMDVVGAFTQRHDRLVGDYAQKEQALRQRAEEAAAAIGEKADAGVIGEQLRNAIADNQKKLDEELSDLYKKVDPNNNMNVIINMGDEQNPSLKTTAQKIKDDKRLLTKFSPGLTEVIEVINEAPSVWRFNELRAADERLTLEMLQARDGADPTSYSRLVQLKRAVKSAMNKAVDNQIAWERAHGENGLERRFGQINPGNAVEGDAASNTGARAAQAGLFGTDELGVRPNGGASSTGDVGSGNVDRGSRLAEKEGREHSLYFGSNSVKARPEIVELSDLLVSHNDDFTENPNYPKEFQPRDRTAAEAQNQVNRFSGSEWEPERYGITQDANSGAPVVGPDNVVESGNGRTMAIRRKYSQGDNSYRDYLESQGFDTSSMENPVLVMRRTTKIDEPSDRQAYVDMVNRESGLRYNATDQSRSDASYLDPETIFKVKPGPLTSENNADFVRSFFTKMPGSERNALVDAKGNLSQRGVNRIEAALVDNAYGHKEVIKRAFESTDNNSKNLTGALTDSSGSWAKMRQAIKDGQIDASHDITEELMNGVDKILLARDKNRPIAEIMDQIDMYASPTTKEVYSLLFNGDKVASRNTIAARLNKYAESALANKSGGFDFGDTRQARDILSDANKIQGDIEEAPQLPGKATKLPSLKEGAGEAMPEREQLKPNMDEGQAEALNKANKQYGENEDRMRPAKGILRTNMGGQYSTMSSQIPSIAVIRGDKGYQNSTNFMRAANNSPDAINAVKEAVLNNFRSAIKNGIVDPKKWSSIYSNFDGAVRAVDEVSPGFRNSLKDPQKTAETVIQYAAKREADIDALNKEQAAKFLGKETVEEVQNEVGSIINQSNPNIAQLRNTLEIMKKENPGAIDGFRKATIDWIVRKDTNASLSPQDQENFSYNKINNLIKDKGHVLEVILTPDQIKTLYAIRDDMALSNRSTDRQKIPNHSNTASDAKAYADKMAAEIADKSFLVLTLEAASHVLHGEGGFGAKAAKTAGFAGLAALLKLRQVGVHSISDLERKMLRDPEIARLALKKIPRDQMPRRGDLILRAIRNQLLNAGNDVEREKEIYREGRATGGRIGRALTADQIISGLERARKAQQKETSVILNRPDEAVVRALSAANQHI